VNVGGDFGCGGSGFGQSVGITRQGVRTNLHMRSEGVDIIFSGRRVCHTSSIGHWLVWASTDRMTPLSHDKISEEGAIGHQARFKKLALFWDKFGP
jgi:hypothetical protein